MQPAAFTHKFPSLPFSLRTARRTDIASSACVNLNKFNGDSQQLCWCHFKVLLIYSSEHHLRYASNSFDRLCTRMRITYPLDYLHIGKQ